MGLVHPDIVLYLGRVQETFHCGNRVWEEKLKYNNFDHKKFVLDFQEKSVSWAPLLGN